MVFELRQLHFAKLHRSIKRPFTWQIPRFKCFSKRSSSRGVLP
jgi:hypothetical protein